MCGDGIVEVGVPFRTQAILLCVAAQLVERSTTIEMEVLGPESAVEAIGDVGRLVAVVVADLCDVSRRCALQRGIVVPCNCRQCHLPRDQNAQVRCSMSQLCCERAMRRTRSHSSSLIHQHTFRVLCGLAMYPGKYLYPYQPR